MPLPPLQGHAQARAALGKAIAAGTLPQSLLLHGPAGIGKERLGLWLAQLLMCEQPTGGAPCEQCKPCLLTRSLQHPDVHWFFPLPRPEGAAADKLRDKLEELRAAELEARRSSAVHIPAFERPPAHFLAAVQTLQRLAQNRPAMAGRKVFVVGDAELMVPQESSPEAANAFLKLLEEPPPDTTLILTAERVGALLPTIVSRVLPVRLFALDHADVVAFLEQSGGLVAGEARRIAALAQGSIGRALRFAPSVDGPGPLEKQRMRARELLEAILAGTPVPRLAAAHATAPTGARGELVVLLDLLAGWLRDLLAVASRAEQHLFNRYDEDFLRRAVQTTGAQPPAVAAALARIDCARALAEGNVNPQLILADLLRTLRTDLRVAG